MGGVINTSPSGNHQPSGWASESGDSVPALDPYPGPPPSTLRGCHLVLAGSALGVACESQHALRMSLFRTHIGTAV
jgi:hypothetical protein